MEFIKKVLFLLCILPASVTLATESENRENTTLHNRHLNHQDLRRSIYNNQQYHTDMSEALNRLMRIRQTDSGKSADITEIETLIMEQAQKTYTQKIDVLSQNIQEHRQQISWLKGQAYPRIARFRTFGAGILTGIFSTFAAILLPYYHEQRYRENFGSNRRRFF